MDHAAFLSDPSKWSHLFCPVKRHVDGKMQVGIYLGGEPIVYRCNMWAIPKDLSTTEQHKYESVAAMVADGWVVD